MKKLLLVVLSLACALSLMVGSMAFAAEYNLMNPPIVDVKDGKLKGFMNEGIYTFLGIQYATAERFEMPQPVAPWEGVKAAQSYGPIAPIAVQKTIGVDEFVWPHRYWIENENCQYLNVWTKDIAATEKKPVMVFLHGGGYSNGSSIEAVAYDGRNLSEFGDVVVVTLNHRLNVLGFLDMSAYGEAYKNSANSGIADLEMALRWIQDNIAAFGGDPENVTIFGQSGGAGKVLTLMRTPSAEGLFNQAIAHSGSASYIAKEDAARLAELTIANLGLTAEQANELKTVPYEQLIVAGDAAIAQLNKDIADTGRSVRWQPCADGEYIVPDYCDWVSDMPLMSGTVFSEQNSTIKIGDGRKNEWTEEEVKANLAERYGENAEKVAAEFAKVYPERVPVDAYFYGYTNRVSTKKTLETKMATGTAPVYNYLFSYEAPVNGGTSAFHCVELIYVFHNVDVPIIRIATGGQSEAYAIQDLMAQAWVNFARTGNPAQEGLEWAPYTSEGQEAMVFDVNSGCRALQDDALVNLMFG